MGRFRRIAGATGPWAVALGVHGAIAAAAALVFVGSSAVGYRPPQPTDGVYSVHIRPAGEAAPLGEPPRGDGRVYTEIEADAPPIDGPIADVPELKITPGSFQPSKPTGAPGIASRHGGHSRIPAGTSGGEGRGSGSLGTGPSGPAAGSGGGTGSPMPAVAVESPGPRYPDSARRRNVEGAAVVEISIRSDGSVERGRIVESSGHAALDEAAVEAVRTWRYRPATLSGKSISSVQRVRFVFRLE